MAEDRVVVIGGGIGGLACAIDLAAQGLAVEVVERASRAGGKMREVKVPGGLVDSGPTVFTMRWVFDALFDAAGASFDDYLVLAPLETLARHAWSERERFDLFADVDAAADAVGQFSGLAEVRRFRAFCKEAQTIYETLKQPFLESARPGPLSLSRRIGIFRPAALVGIRPFETLWGALSKTFHDPRLRQLFGRYATYNGSSPFSAPATLMLIAHVERDGVWVVTGGMQRLAEALQRLAVSLGVTFRFDSEVAQITVERGRASGVTLRSGERLSGTAIVVNADAVALTAGLFGQAAVPAGTVVAPHERSLSAVTWSLSAETSGFPLLRHNVFFSKDYAEEFGDLFDRSQLPRDPTVYICAQDRGGVDQTDVPSSDRLLMLVNAPARGDVKSFTAKEIAECETKMTTRLRHCGLSINSDPTTTVTTTPADFNRLFPATGGALYGRASHGWTASFQRPASQSKVPGLYLAGGSTHPGAGVPMAALSGRLAAASLLADRRSTRRSRPPAIFGGTSTG